MPASGRWKMVDNLRRTLSPIMCLLALMAGWLLPFDAAGVLDDLCRGHARAAQFVPVLAGIAPRHAGLSQRIHFKTVMSDFRLALLQSLLIITLLAHQAWLMGDAITSTLVRLFITRRDLLEWTPSAQPVPAEPGSGGQRRRGSADRAVVRAGLAGPAHRRERERRRPGSERLAMPAPAGRRSRRGRSEGAGRSAVPRPRPRTARAQGGPGGGFLQAGSPERAAPEARPARPAGTAAARGRVENQTVCDVTPPAR